MPPTITPVILKHQKKEDGTYNLKIRVTIERKTAYISTPKYIDKSMLDSKLGISKDYMKKARKYLRSYDDALDALGDNVYSFSAKRLAEYLVREVRPINESLNFMDFLNQKCTKLKENHKSNYDNYKALYNHLVRFDSDYIEYKDITSGYLKLFEKHLLDNKVGYSGIAKYMGCLRATFNDARNEFNDDDTGSIKIKNYPFTKYKIPKEPDSIQKASGADIIVSVIKYEPKTERCQFAKDMFILSFYLIGMNAIDIFECKEKIKSGRLTYQRSKTKDKRSDNAEISIKIEPEVKPLIEKYCDKDNIHTFNIYKRYQDAKNLNYILYREFKVIREDLGIDKLTFYSARHSWATIASHNCNIIDSHIAKCLNHVSLEHRITNKYIKRDWSLIDKCNRQVIDFVNERLKEKSEL